MHKITHHRAQCNHNGLYKWLREAERREGTRDSTDFEDGGGDQSLRNVVGSGSWMSKETDAIEPSEGTQHGHTMILAQ